MMAPDPNLTPTTDDPCDEGGRAPTAPGAPSFPVRATDILERIADAFVMLDRQWRVVYANQEACRINQKTLEEFTGRTHWEEWPASVGTEVERQYRRAMAEGVDVHFEHRSTVTSSDVWLEIDAYPSEQGLSLFYRDVSARKKAEEALRTIGEQFRATQARLEAALSAGGIATWTWDIVGDRVVAESNLAPLFSVSDEDAAGGRLDAYLQAVHPDDRDRVAQAIGDAVTRGDDYEIEYRVVLPDGGDRWLVARGIVERDDTGRAVAMPGVVVDITRQVERGRRERFLADLASRARDLTDPDAVIADAVNSVGEFLGVARCLFVDIDIQADLCTTPADFRADESVVSMAGSFPLSDFGAHVVSAYAAGQAVAVDDVQADPVRVPPESVAAYEAVGIRAHIGVPLVHSSRLVSVIAVHSRTPRHWLPEEVELLRSVVERTWLTVEVIRQQHALTRETEERREAHARTAAILESITDAFFTLDADWRFTSVNAEAERVLFRSRERLLGRGIWEAFPEGNGSTFDRQYRRAVAEGVAVSFEEYFPPLDTWFEVRAYPSSDGLSVFFQDVNARKTAEAERERMLAKERVRAEREALINRINEAIRGINDPDAVQEAAVTLLGEALGADRCYLAGYDLGRGVVSIARDWHRADLASIRGVYPFVNTVTMYQELYQGSNTSVIPDADTAPLSAQTRANMKSLDLRSRVSVALMDGEDLMASLTAAMADGPRDWSDDDVSLIETVATQVRTAVATARVTLREHNIAQQLQEALQPALPGTVPGLALTKYYRPALAEAGVGGDFYDVYALEKGCTALVVGDLSGKGLAAAAQVSTVRNMLRAFLYSQPTVAEALTELNRVLAENNLLTGFTTLFVGAYESVTGQLKYVNCGQEPALVRRGAGGAVEELEANGPILGAIENARYAEDAVTLAPGDVLAVFTDGLTEVGASRTNMLGAEGVAALLARPVTGDDSVGAKPMADYFVRTLITSVDAYAQTGARDDMCLLVAAVP